MHLHVYLKKHTDLKQKKWKAKKPPYYEETRCIQIYKSSEKGQNANKKADTSCQKNQCLCAHWIWSGVTAYAAGWFMLDYCIKLAMSKIYSLHSSSSVANILCLTWRTPRPLGSRGNKKGLWSFFNSFLSRFHWYWTYRIPSICLASFLVATKGFPQLQRYFLGVNCLFYLTWPPPNCPAGFCYLPACHSSTSPTCPSSRGEQPVGSTGSCGSLSGSVPQTAELTWGGSLSCPGSSETSRQCRWIPVHKGRCGRAAFTGGVGTSVTLPQFTQLQGTAHGSPLLYLLVHPPGRSPGQYRSCVWRAHLAHPLCLWGWSSTQQANLAYKPDPWKNHRHTQGVQVTTVELCYRGSTNKTSNSSVTYTIINQSRIQSRKNSNVTESKKSLSSSPTTDLIRGKTIVMIIKVSTEHPQCSTRQLRAPCT